MWWGKIPGKTRMHSSRMRTACSLTVSHRKNHACPPQQPCMPPWEHPRMPPLGATTHAPRATTHAPRSNHTCPPRATMHIPPEQPRMPPQEQPCMPPRSNHARPPPRGQTDTCKNITFANFVCGR